jgi:hypothetical protein
VKNALQHPGFGVLQSIFCLLIGAFGLNNGNGAVLNTSPQIATDVSDVIIFKG